MVTPASAATARISKMRKVHLLHDRQAVCGKRFVECTVNRDQVTCEECLK